MDLVSVGYAVCCGVLKIGLLPEVAFGKQLGGVIHAARGAGYGDGVGLGGRGAKEASRTFNRATDAYIRSLEEEMERTLRESDRAEQWVMKMVELLRTRVKPGNDNHTAVAVMNC